ncbi:unnamed protein product [Heligmosomoides polygyrus]|uniref:Peptidase_M13 domain-containing protein n=1 Tax=Heligmosomoides polygyrus TaxID=6339 RepID=A0A3P8EUS0_HELPZ|nr:unnamed protein product [Heligmosomoides polygyrus]
MGAYIYGAVGIVIAHEISHGFDKGGMRFDHTGKRTEWYRSEWIDDFNKALQCYVQQYDNTTIPIFDKPLNGALTLNENVADNEGMKIVYKATTLDIQLPGETPRRNRPKQFWKDEFRKLAERWQRGHCP